MNKRERVLNIAYMSDEDLESLTITELSQLAGVPYKTLEARLRRGKTRRQAVRYKRDDVQENKSRLFEEPNVNDFAPLDMALNTKYLRMSL